MEITEELYTVYKIKNNKIIGKEFDNFEDAYDFFREDKDECSAGKIVHQYKITEEFYNFDRRGEIV